MRLEKLHKKLTKILEQKIKIFRKKFDTKTRDFYLSFPYYFRNFECHPEHKDLIEIKEILLSNDIKKITQKNLQFASRNVSGYDETSFIEALLNDLFNYAIPRVINLKNPLESFDRIYKRFEEEFFKDKIKVNSICRLLNFSYTGGTDLKLNSDCWIEYIHPVDFGRSIYNERSSYNTALFHELEKSFIGGLKNQNKEKERFKHPFCCIFYDFYINKDKPNKVNLHKIFRKILLILRSVCRGSVYFDFFSASYFGQYSFYNSHKWSYPEYSIDANWLHPTMLNHEAEVHWIKKLWQGSQKVNYQTIAVADHKLEDAYKRILHQSSSYDDIAIIRDLLDKILDYFQAFESLYKTETELRYKISLYTAWLVGFKKDENFRKDVFHFMKKMYDLRSKYIHGNLDDVIRKKGEKTEKFKSDVNKLEYYLKQCIQMFLINPNLQNQLDDITTGNISILSDVYSTGGKKNLK